MADAAGLTAEQMANLDWNPQDGGSYEKAIAHLTVDKNGVRGDEAGFDKNNVAVYGLGLAGGGSGQGQTEWSFLTATTGWTHTDKNPWGTEFNYDDPKLPGDHRLVGRPDRQGLHAQAGNHRRRQPRGQLRRRQGRDQHHRLLDDRPVHRATRAWKPAIAPTPKGPDGKRASMFNGLADSVWAGTKNPAAPSSGSNTSAPPPARTSSPRRPSSSRPSPAPPRRPPRPSRPRASTSRAFTTHVKDGTTFLFPITDKAAKVDGIMKPAMDAVLVRQEAGQLAHRSQRPGQRPLQVGPTRPGCRRYLLAAAASGLSRRPPHCTTPHLPASRTRPEPPKETRHGTPVPPLRQHQPGDQLRQRGGRGHPLGRRSGQLPARPGHPRRPRPALRRRRRRPRRAPPAGLLQLARPPRPARAPDRRRRSRLRLLRPPPRGGSDAGRCRRPPSSSRPTPTPGSRVVVRPDPARRRPAGTAPHRHQHRHLAVPARRTGHRPPGGAGRRRTPGPDRPLVPGTPPAAPRHPAGHLGAHRPARPHRPRLLTALRRRNRRLRQPPRQGLGHPPGLERQPRTVRGQHRRTGAP